MYDPRLSQFFGKIFVLFDDYVNNTTHFKYFHAQCNEEFAKDVPDFSQKKLCVMVQSNHFVQHPKSEYGERRKAADFFGKSDEFDLFGARWDGYPTWKGAFKTGKLDLIKNYKFCLAYENIKDQKGYMTERLFECFYAGCVPIYLGPKNVYDYVPKECFINRIDFDSYEELYRFMKSMDRETYESYIRAGQEFIKSPLAGDLFDETICENVSRTSEIRVCSSLFVHLSSRQLVFEPFPYLTILHRIAEKS